MVPVPVSGPTFESDSKDSSSNRNSSFKQGTPAGVGTTSTAKTPATAGSVWKAIKVAGHEVRNMVVNVAVIKKCSGRERSPSGSRFC
jgi:hypothetical protein